MPFIAYKITHTESGKAYIGITTRALKARWAAHGCPSRGPNAMGAAIIKYGRDAFSVEHIASARSLPDLLLLERALIAQYGTLAPNGYNLTSGGDGMLNPSQETRRRMSSSASKRTGRIISEATKAKIAASLKGHGFTAGTLAKMRAAKLGSKASPETRAKLSAMRMGRKMPPRVVAGQLGLF